MFYILRLSSESPGVPVNLYMTIVFSDPVQEGGYSGVEAGPARHCTLVAGRDNSYQAVVSVLAFHD